MSSVFGHAVELARRVVQAARLLDDERRQRGAGGSRRGAPRSTGTTARASASPRARAAPPSSRCRCAPAAPGEMASGSARRCDFGLGRAHVRAVVLLFLFGRGRVGLPCLARRRSCRRRRIPCAARGWRRHEHAERPDAASSDGRTRRGSRRLLGGRESTLRDAATSRSATMRDGLVARASSPACAPRGPSPARRPRRSRPRPG